MIKVEIKCSIPSQLASKPQGEDLKQQLVPLPGVAFHLSLDYVGLRLDPPGVTDFWGADVVPTG